MGNRPEDYDNEIDFVQDTISKYFPVYKTEVDFDIITIYVQAPPKEELEDRFESLRKELVPKNYIPRIIEKHGEHLIKVKKQEERKFRSIKTNAVMLGITIATTLIAGAWWWSNYDPVGQGIFTLHNLRNGALYYTLPVLLILGTHEMGHYFLARYHGIKASLPFFIPMLPPLGTLGAVISIREPIPDKKSLLDLGVAGPIAGFVVTIPITIIGLYLSSVMPATVTPPTEGIRQVWNLPAIMQGLDILIPWEVGDTMHPTLFAGWLGFLVTGLNLLPASQLDGGHVFRALFGEKSKYVSYAAFAFLMIMGIWMYLGWLILGFFILFLAGVKHPPPLNDLTDLDKKRVIVGAVGIGLLLVSFHPLPIEQEEFSYEFKIEVEEELDQEVIFGESVNYTLTLENQAENVDVDEGIEYRINYSLSDDTWYSNLWIKEDDEWIRGESPHNITLEEGRSQTYKLEIRPVQDSIDMENEVIFTAETDVARETMERNKTMNVIVGYGFDFEIESEILSLDDDNIGISRIEDQRAKFNFSLWNRGQKDSFELASKNVSSENWSFEFLDNEEQKETLDLELSYGEEVNITSYLKSVEDNDDNIVTEIVVVRSKETGQEKLISVIGIRT